MNSTTPAQHAFGMYERLILNDKTVIRCGDMFTLDGDHFTVYERKALEDEREKQNKERSKKGQPLYPPVPYTGAYVVAILFRPEEQNTEYEYTELEQVGGRVVLTSTHTTLTPAAYEVWVRPFPDKNVGDVLSEDGKLVSKDGVVVFEDARCERVPFSSVHRAIEVWGLMEMHNEVTIKLLGLEEESEELREGHLDWMKDHEAKTSKSPPESTGTTAPAPNGGT
jgi:hypothetical protein